MPCITSIYILVKSFIILIVHEENSKEISVITYCESVITSPKSEKILAAV
jgi:hypothetical protein